MRSGLRLAVSALIVLTLVAGYFIVRGLRPTAGRLTRLRAYWSDPSAHADWAIEAGARCGEAPFLLPTSGLVGFLWGDSFRPGHAHQGLDIFGPSGPNGLGQTPVLAVYDGFLTRLPEWRSSLILRIPSDPLRPGRQIWVYYTHLADAQGRSFIEPAFPSGTHEQFVRAGTRLGYQGNYSADPDNPTGMHLHISIVRDDGRGRFLNELEIDNTLDPSPYFGLPANAATIGDRLPVCPPDAP